MTELHFSQALLPDGWAPSVRVRLADGRIAAMAAHAPGTGGGIAVPGLANLHSHAFQRAMAGLTETAGPATDSFWTWREVMYRFLGRLTPEHVEAIAALAYAEMLEAGFTAVAEFHYLHHAPDGTPYADPAELAGRIVAAAAATGIALTLLPVLYSHGGFGGQPASPGQRRFLNTLEGFEALHARARRHAAAWPGTVVGAAPHSLRAVTPEQLDRLAAANPDGPLHIHAAEQPKEVADCLAWSGRRPVEWLLAHQRIDARWCLVHATHMTAAETRALAASRAVAGLCPITEANLGDGVFALRDYLAAGGCFGIGTDSNVKLDAAEELRLLEYGQRLTHGARNVVAAAAATDGTSSGASSGRTLCDAARTGGAQALGRAPAALAVGAPADLVILDPEHPALLARSGDGWLDSWIFAADRGAIREVWAGGRRVVADGRHVAQETIRRRYAAVMRALLQ
jgi:formiminoglutamate deiminase